MAERTVSVVINTYNRAESLALTLSALAQLDYPHFEVVVVNGPSTDDTEALLATYSDRIKIGRCDDRNLSESRNIGIKLAAGDIVAFIDDDAYPDPGWLTAIVNGYDWEEGAVGGPVFGHTGFWYQVWSSRADRFGNAWDDFPPMANMTELLAFPGSEQFVYTIGTNSSFRRDRLVEIGGFDEEFRYYLDETDVCRRIVDAGWLVRSLDSGFVYHKFLASDIRDKPGITKDWFQVLKSRAYFGLKHGLPYAGEEEVGRQMDGFVTRIRAEIQANIKEGHFGTDVLTKFDQDVKEATALARERYASGEDRTRPKEWFTPPEPFKPFPILRPAGEKLHLCFLSQEYPPVAVNGIGRVISFLAEGLAAEGHVVRVITKGEGHPRVDLEHGVWVHRIPTRGFDRPGDLSCPQHIWEHSSTVFEELCRMDEIRPIDIVQAPNWDSEGVATLVSRRFPLVVGLYTPLKTVLGVDPVMRKHQEAGDPMLNQLVELERITYQEANGFLACGPAVVEEIEQAYDVTFDRSRLGFVPHGLPDLLEDYSGPLPAADTGPLKLLFVGRLEARKGIDIILDTVVELTARGVAVELTVVGDDTLPGPGGKTYRAAFESRHRDLRNRVRFVGRIDDTGLVENYARCDVFVAPSRFESFGLMLIEAMMFSKPVVCADAGGMREIVEHGETGFRVSTEDVKAWADTLETLARDPALRTTIGEAGRRLYETRFSVPAMAAGAEAFYRSLTP